MREELKKINKRLEEMFPGRKPSIQIFSDESWMVEISCEDGFGRIVGELDGDSIDSLEEQLKIKLS